MLIALVTVNKMIHVQVECTSRNNLKPKMYKFDHQEPFGVKIFLVVHSLLAGVTGNNPSQVALRMLVILTYHQKSLIKTRTFPTYPFNFD